MLQNVSFWIRNCKAKPNTATSIASVFVNSIFLLSLSLGIDRYRSGGYAYLFHSYIKQNKSIYSD